MTKINISSNVNVGRRNLLLLIATISLTAIIAIYLVYWFIILRNQQSTDDAYVTGNQVQIIAQISGSVTQINFENTDLVMAGDVLVTLDKTDAEIAFNQAKNELANVVRQTKQLVIDSKQYQADIAKNRIAFEQATSDYRRRQALGSSKAIAVEDLQHAKDAVSSAKAALEASIQQYAANQALLLDRPISQQPAILVAADKVRDSWLTLQRTEIRSPVTGYVSRRDVQLGSLVNTSTPLMAIVPASNVWIDANFKETQLTNMRIGQPVKVVSDIYGDSVIYTGRVIGIDMGTGSAFSLLPAQNATGNWIKVVQRVPVRIELDQQQIEQSPLRIGLSTVVTVNVKNTNGEELAKTQRKVPAYQSDALVVDLAPVNSQITTIIQLNAN